MILMNDFKAEPEELLHKQLKAVERTLRSGWYVLGKELESFEQAWAKYCDIEFAVGVGNGMDALEIGLRALDIGVGDEVITTPMTAFATVLAIIRAGATPVLADIDPETALLDIHSVERCLSPKTKAVLLVHLYGQVKNMDAWRSFCDDKELHLLEDCAQAHSASWNNKMAGAFGSWGAYSFYPTKNLGTIGDGGAFVTSSATLANRAKILRNYGQTERYHHPEIGMNSRLDELQAAILMERLLWLDSFTARRKEIAKMYLSEINNPAITMLTPPVKAENHVYHLFVVRCKQRDVLASFLREREISTLIHYPVPIHYQSPCKEIQKDPEGLQHAENHANYCLSLPCHPQMSDTDIQKVIATVNAFK